MATATLEPETLATAADLDHDTDDAPDAGGIVLDHSQIDVTRHDGIVTVGNPATGSSRTFRIRTERSGSLRNKRIVSILNGPNNDPTHGDWMGFAFVDSFGMSVWRRFRGINGRSDWEKFAEILESPRRYAESKGLVYMMAARCRRCGRVLTALESVTSGYGPVCAGRI